MEALKTLSVLIVLINVIVHGSSNLEIVHNSLKDNSSKIPDFLIPNDTLTSKQHHRHHHGELQTSKRENSLFGETTVISITVENIPEVTEKPINFPPMISKRIQKIAVTAGKVLNYSIPKDTFFDREDGNNLTVELKDNFNKRLSNNSWIQFNGREIIAIPLDEHVSKWNFLIIATDSGNETVQDNLEIIVRQHKGYRTVNHEFQLDFEYPVQNFLDLQLKLIESLKQVTDNNQTEITIRQASIILANLSSEVMYEKVVFAWSNDSVPRDRCPKDVIDHLFEKLSPKFDGILSTQFRDSLVRNGLDLRNARVRWQGIDQCKSVNNLVPEQATLPANYSPFLRNPIDTIDAVEGVLLVFKVPYDTFFDPEDGNTQNLRLQLLGKDHEILPDNFWLQFDSKNQEFFGLPLVENIGQFELYLQCTDRGNLTSFDALIVIVHQAQHGNFNTKFSATLSLDYDHLSPGLTKKMDKEPVCQTCLSPIIKRKLIEHLISTISPHLNTNIIHVIEINQSHTTTVAWYNTSLPTEQCATEEISALKSRFYSRNSGLYNQKRVSDGVFDSIRFSIESVNIDFIGNCKTLETVMTDFHVVENDYDISLKQINSPDQDDEDIYKDAIILDDDDDDDYRLRTSQQDYFVTFLLPALLIIVALKMSLCIVFFLIRKRKQQLSEKSTLLHSVNNHGGVPIIFQDELIDDQYTDRVNAPAIFDQEKPPLTPPKLFSNRPIVGKDLVAKCDTQLKKSPPPYSGR